MSEKNSNNVDQIRDLIFGSQIHEFEARFEHLEKALQASEAQMMQALDETFNAFRKKTDRSLEALEEKLDHFGATAIKERVKFKELVDATDESLQDQLNSHKEEFTSKLKLIKENMVDDNKKVSNDLVKMRQEVLDRLEKYVQDLSHEKVSRDSMAQMLLDVAMKLQGTTVHSLVDLQKTHEEKGSGK